MDRLVKQHTSTHYMIFLYIEEAIECYAIQDKQNGQVYVAFWSPEDNEYIPATIIEEEEEGNA